MAGIRQAREDFEKEQPYRSNEELVEQQTEFCILQEPTVDTDGQFGPTWVLPIVFLDEQGEHVAQQIFLSAGKINKMTGKYKENSYRRWLFTKKLSYPVHHVVLTQGVATNGMKYNDIDDAPNAVDPCPCMTGDWVEGAINKLLYVTPPMAEAEVVDGPISDAERERYLNGIYNLGNKMGWPVDKDSLNQKSGHELKKLYQNWGALSAKQTSSVHR